MSRPLTKRDEIFQAIVDALHRNSATTLGSDKLIDDLGFDSLSFEELSLALEAEFNIGGITPEEQSKWVTVKDVIDMVEQKLAPEEIETAKREAER